MARGGLVLDAEQKAKLQAVLWVDGHINAKVVAQPATFIADMAGFEVPDGNAAIMAEKQVAAAAHERQPRQRQHLAAATSAVAA